MLMITTRSKHTHTRFARQMCFYKDPVDEIFDCRRYLIDIVLLAAAPQKKKIIANPNSQYWEQTCEQRNTTDYRTPCHGVRSRWHRLLAFFVSNLHSKSMSQSNHHHVCVHERRLFKGSVDQSAALVLPICKHLAQTRNSSSGSRMCEWIDNRIRDDFSLSPLGTLHILPPRSRENVDKAWLSF